MHLSFRLSIKLVGLPEFQLKSLVKVQLPSFPVSDILEDEFLSKNINFGEFLSKNLTFWRFVYDFPDFDENDTKPWRNSEPDGPTIRPRSPS